MTGCLRHVIAGWTTVFVCGLAPAAALAQATAASQSSASTPTTFIPAIVTNQQGSPVPGLDQSAFAVREGDRSIPITSFSLESGPVGLVLVVDASASVGDTALSNVRESIRRIVQSTHRESEFFVIGLAGEVRALDWTADRTRVLSALDDLTQLRKAAPRGMATPLHDGVLRGVAAAEQSRFRKRAVIIISDGMDTRSRATRDDAEAALRATSAVVYSMMLESTQPAMPRLGLMRLADVTGGRAFNVDDPGDWTAATDRIAADLQHVYLIGVNPDVSRRGWRRVSVALASPPGERLTVRSRTGYVVPRR